MPLPTYVAQHTKTPAAALDSQPLHCPTIPVPPILTGSIPSPLQVAILCNHQRSVPKTHEASMAKATEKLNVLREEIKDLEDQHSKALKGKGGNPDA